MIPILLAAAFGLIISIMGTPVLRNALVKKQFGQYIREEGPQSHQSKSGTPTMGGLVILIAMVAGFFLSLWLTAAIFNTSWVPSASVLVALFLTLGMGWVGFIDDYRKVMQRQNEGLKPKEKIFLQGAIGTIFAVLALFFKDENGWAPATTKISFTRDLALDLAFAGPVLGMILFIIWANLISTAATNAVNLTDGLDGLVSGIAIMVFSGYMLMSMWQMNHLCAPGSVDAVCYEVRDPHQMAMLAASLVGALIGFLWWNTNPAAIFMGDTGSLGLGGALAAFAILSHTELLMPIMAAMFVVSALSVIMQVSYFKATGGKRIFRMSPLHHHFELMGWKEVQVVVRYWIMAGLFVLIALSIFYGDWLLGHGGVIH